MIETVWSIIVHLGGLLLTFYSLCILCDEHLVPAVEVFIKQFQVPEEVAAVTLVAFGSAAPELFLNSVSAFTHTSDLSLSAILGSGMIAFGFIPPLCLLCTPHSEMAVRVYPILRECGFYLIGLVVFVSSLQDGQITTNEALIHVFVYLCYVSMVMGLYWYEKQHRELKRLLHAYPELNEMASDGNYHHHHELQPSSSSSSLKLQDIQTLMQNQSALSRKDGKGISPTSSALRIATSPLNLSASYSEDVDDARSTENLGYNHYYERLLDQAHILISKPLREALKFLVPTLLADDPAVPFNLFNILQKSYTNMLSMMIGMNLNNPPTPSSISRQLRLQASPRVVENVTPEQMNRDGDEESSPLITPSIPVTVNRSSSNSPHNLHNSDEDDQHRVPLWRAIFVVVTCVIGISISASVIVFTSESLIGSMGMDISTMGVTLVAFGSEIPDTISAIALARNGYHDGALAGAIGSQVINISLGVGIPSLFVCLTGRGYLRLAHHEADNLWFLACLLFIVITSFIVLTVPIQKCRQLPNYTALTKASATIQISVCLIIYCIFLSFN